MTLPIPRRAKPRGQRSAPRAAAPSPSPWRCAPSSILVFVVTIVKLARNVMTLD